MGTERLICFAIVLAFFCVVSANSQSSTTLRKEVDKKSREGRLFPIFQVVRFNNDGCGGTNNLNGTCYTAAECTSKGGTNTGACASGYGVCCTFSFGCGATSRENCTYFSVSAATSGVCKLTTCPCNNNICQLRLDFNSFTITGPTTESTVVGAAIFNDLVTKAISGRPVSTNGQCLTDTFSVTNPGGTAPSVICGVNTGQHLYVDSSDECNDLTFQLGNAAIGTTLATRNWNIKITQYSCDYPNLAPDGCDQYFFGSNTGSVSTFNYVNPTTAGQTHLANQDETFCVRRERGNCRICWYQAAAIDFQVSGTGLVVLKKGSKGAAVGYNAPSRCCQYGKTTATGKGVKGFDCVEIPGAMNQKAGFVPSRICGRLLVTDNSATNSATVCSTDIPFQIRFVSDRYENPAEASSVSPDPGFKLVYHQDGTNC